LIGEREKGKKKISRAYSKLKKTVPKQKELTKNPGKAGEGKMRNEEKDGKDIREFTKCFSPFDQRKRGEKNYCKFERGITRCQS